ncbi:MAG: hypothetical protein Q8R44_10695 [Novosphingobium sp.]|nr:hypothetical protein [Novosphingobium sp.]
MQVYRPQHEVAARQDGRDPGRVRGPARQVQGPGQGKDEQLAALGPLGPDIVESQSTATGTALPSAFVPAKPLHDKSHKDGKKHM